MKNNTIHLIIAICAIIIELTSQLFKNKPFDVTQHVLFQLAFWTNLIYYIKFRDSTINTKKIP